MNLRLLATPLVAATLLLSTLGCSKKSDPAPTLEGSWNVTSIVSTQYHGDGTQYYQATATFPAGNDANARYDTFTSTTFQHFYRNGAASNPAELYTRSSNTIAFSVTTANSSTPTPTGEASILQLTASELILLSRLPAGPIVSSPYDYNTSEVHYTRR